MYHISIMKKHISATIDEQLLKRAKICSIAENRTLSNVIELALSQFLLSDSVDAGLVSTEGSFQGQFTREDTYDRA